MKVGRELPGEIPLYVCSQPSYPILGSGVEHMLQTWSGEPFGSYPTIIPLSDTSAEVPCKGVCLC